VLETDIFIFDESFDGELTESKLIGAHPLHRLDFLQERRHSRQYAERRKIGNTIGARKLGEVKKYVEDSLLYDIEQFQNGKLNVNHFRSKVTETMRDAWRDAFHAGARAAGVPGLSVGGTKIKMRLSEMDDAFLQRAMAHEMRYLNGFLNDVIEDTCRMPMEQRVGMYRNSLRSFYDNARIIGLPRETVIHWCGPDDNKTCAGCRYLFEQQPFTKYTLPTVPRSGSTRCLCLVDPHVQILTDRGYITWEKLRTTDYVFTHMNRWQKILRKTINHSTSQHHYFDLVGLGGAVVTVTHDHQVYTPLGWRQARDAWAMDLNVCCANGPEPFELTADFGNVQPSSRGIHVGSPLYDLEVEEDHSFVAEGLILHNSNCRDFLYCVKATPREARIVESGSAFTREQHVDNLRKIFRSKAK
jgi:hypothetical protein